MNFDFLHNKLNQRKSENALRELKLTEGLIDFSSNDYLGIAANRLAESVSGIDFTKLKHGSAGSRLIAGNSTLAEETERYIAGFHEAEAALLFNSGYDANLGILSCVPQKGDHIIYDQLSHASLRDGIRLSFATAYSFKHNSVSDLEKRLQLPCEGNRFVVTESVFSMDGDMPPLQKIIDLCKKYNAHLILDEAHAIGVIGLQGEGLAQSLNLHHDVFARIFTFGKAGGCHGACVVGSGLLRTYLINFCRSFIYTTALPETSIAAIKAFYHLFPGMNAERNHLKELIYAFRNAGIRYNCPLSDTPIQIVMIPGNEEVKRTEQQLIAAGINAKAILYPTVPAGSERLRIVLHAYNTAEELALLTGLLK